MDRQTDRYSAPRNDHSNPNTRMQYLEHETSTVSSTFRTFVLLHPGGGGGTAEQKKREGGGGGGGWGERGKEAEECGKQ